MTALPVVLLLSGPNLALLGERQPEVYGPDTLADHVARFTAALDGVATVEHVQADGELGLIQAVHAARGRCAAIVVNAASCTHHAWGLHDALAAYDGPVIEVHLSNPDAREPWRRTSVVAPVATGTIAGFGGHGYRLAVIAVAELLAQH